MEKLQYYKKLRENLFPEEKTQKTDVEKRRLNFLESGVSSQSFEKKTSTRS